MARLSQFQSLSESDTAEEQVVAGQHISATPASVATSASELQSQEAKVELTYQKSQLSQQNLMAFEEPMVEELPPEKWLKKIRQLIDKGDIKTARKELADFRLRYPDEEIEQSILDAIK